MPGHDIIVIGASAGGIRAVSGVIAMLPADLPAAVFVALHLAADGPGRVPEMIAEASALTVGPAVDGERIVHGHVYVAPPDHHLLVGRDYVRVLRGPRENRFRPSIDVLFRSGARAYGPRVIGVVLTGYLADGTLGLQAIKRRGGITIAQDPRDAEYPGMPENALRYARVDHRLRLTDIPSRLIELVAEPAPEEELHPVPLDLEVEARIAEQEMSNEELLEAVQLIGRRTPFTCPECSGSIWQIGEGESGSLRCHVGHAFSREAFGRLQTQALENALWTAVRVMEEKMRFAQERAERLRKLDLLDAARSYEEYADGLGEEAAAIRNLIFNGVATRAEPPGEPEQLPAT